MSVPRLLIRTTHLVAKQPIFSQYSCRIRPRFVHTSNCAYAARLYTDKHEWVEVRDNGIGIVGISDYAQQALGDVVYAQLPDINTVLKQKGKHICSTEKNPFSAVKNNMMVSLNIH
nr:unnamed protein product [Callosobruchus chinensis]